MAKRFLSNIRINDAYTFPASDGLNNQVIKTDGSGNLSFAQLAADSASVMYKDTFTGNGSATVFNMANALNDEVQSNIYIDGVYQSKSTYSIANKAITFSTAPASGHEIEVISTTGINNGPTAIYTDTFTANGSATAFTLGQTVHSENQTMVFLNGVYQFKGTYALSGTTLTLDTAPANGVAIEVMSIGSAYSGGDILYDHDFTSAGLMTSNGSGVYSITANNSANWNTAYGWGDHGLSAQDKTDISNLSGTNTGDQDLSSYATQSYVGTQISNLVDSSPTTLNTLNELAAALGDDPNYATATAISIGNKLPLAGGTLTGALTGTTANFSGHVTLGDTVTLGGNVTIEGNVFMDDYNITSVNHLDFGFTSGYIEGSGTNVNFNGLSATFGGRIIANNYVSIKTASSSGSPYIDFIQNTTQKAYIQFNDGANALNFQSDNAFTFIGGTAERVRIDGSGNVGIGTTSIPNPFSSAYSNILQVGTTGGNTRLAITAGSTSSSDLNFADSNDATNVGSYVGAISYKHNGDYMLFSTDGSEKMRIDSSGNVGIGGSPSVNFEIAKAGARIKMIDGTNQLNMGLWDGANYRFEGDANRPMFFTSYQGNINFGISGGTTMTIQNAAVGIGTTAPTTALSVSDGAAMYGNSNYLVQIKRNALNGDDNTSKASILLANKSNGMQIAYGGTTDRLRFIDGGGVERITMLNGGNIGIGTTSPNKELTLGGAAGTQTLSFTTSAYLGDQAVIGNIEFSTHNADTSYKQLANIYALKTGTNTNSGDITFWTKKNGARSEKIRIENDGTLRVKEGSVLVETVGQGIYLGGTAAANKLDDYEEGTWTPQVYYQNSTDQSNATNTVQEGKYTKIGNLVYVSFRLDFNQSGSPANDNIGVKNLPFAGANNHYGTNGNAVTTSSIKGMIFQLPTAGSTQAVLVDSSNASNYGDDIGSGNGRFIRGSFTYHAQ